MKYRVEMSNLNVIENDNYSYYNQIAFNIEVDKLSNLPQLIKTGYDVLVETEKNDIEFDIEFDGLWDFEEYTVTKLYELK
jgi:hypothetical protein